MGSDNENNVMAAVMHLQRAMKRGPMPMPAFGPQGRGPHPAGHGIPGPEGARPFGMPMEGGAPHGEFGPGTKGPDRKHEHNMNEGRLIFLLSKEGSLTTSELIEKMDLRPSSMSELLTKLENRGLVTRSQSEDDKRVNIVSLTDKARNIQGRISEERAARMAVFTACFTEDEAAEFCRLCNKLSDHLESLKMVR